MERIIGIPGSDSRALRESGADLDGFARRGALMYLEMIFRDSFYHADPHPGNLMLLPNGVIGVIDCGMVGRLDEKVRQGLEELLVAASERDAGELAEVILRLGEAPLDCPRDKLRADINSFLGDYVGQSLAELNTAQALSSLVEIIRSYNIALPADLALLLRTLILLEGTSRRFDAQFSLAEAIRPYYFKMVRRRIAPRKLAARLRRSLRVWERLLDSFPRDLGDVLERLRSGTFDIHLDHRHLEPSINRLVMGLLTASLFLGSSLLWAMKAPPLLGGISLFGSVGYLLAVWRGWRLVRAIHRSGDIDSSKHEP